MPEDATITHVLLMCAECKQKALFSSLFEISGLNAVFVESDAELLAHLKAHPVDVLLLEAVPPEPHAFETLVELRRAGSAFREIPVVLAFSEDTPPELVVQAMHLGAYDCLVAPFNEIELLTKITVLAKIKQAEDEFRELAIRDKLTGLYDRRYLQLRFREELSRAKRYNKPISCLAFDLDNFQETNQKYGAEAGDLLLQMVADVLTHAKREIDVLARAGADDFILALYNTDETGAMVLASRLLARLHELRAPFDPSFRLSASLGLASVMAGPELTVPAQELQHRAELAMHRARSDGGDRIVVFNAEMLDDLLTK